MAFRRALPVLVFLGLVAGTSRNACADSPPAPPPIPQAPSGPLSAEEITHAVYQAAFALDTYFTSPGHPLEGCFSRWMMPEDLARFQKAVGS